MLFPVWVVCRILLLATSVCRKVLLLLKRNRHLEFVYKLWARLWSSDRWTEWNGGYSLCCYRMVLVELVVRVGALRVADAAPVDDAAAAAAVVVVVVSILICMMRVEAEDEKKARLVVFPDKQWVRSDRLLDTAKAPERGTVVPADKVVMVAVIAVYRWKRSLMVDCCSIVDCLCPEV